MKVATLAEHRREKKSASSSRNSCLYHINGAHAPTNFLSWTVSYQFIVRAPMLKPSIQTFNARDGQANQRQVGSMPTNVFLLPCHITGVEFKHPHYLVRIFCKLNGLCKKFWKFRGFLLYICKKKNSIVLQKNITVSSNILLPKKNQNLL